MPGAEAGVEVSIVKEYCAEIELKFNEKMQQSAITKNDVIRLMIY
tara:strand:- start:359 stop:493 length:135 start_codon:yes stop_codon:yes gene_type:complete